MAKDLLKELGYDSSPEIDQSHIVPESSIAEYAISAAEVQEAAKNSLDFLAALATPLIFQYCYPPVLLAVWELITSTSHKTRDFTQLALGLPRGFGKTTLIKLYILYCILFTDKKFILVISSSASLAENILADVVDMLNEPNIKQAFGDWSIGLEKDTQAIKKFGFRGRNIILAGLGAGTSLRGLNLKNERPDVMIFEDVQTRECADSAVQSTALESWMVGTAMKAKSPHGCTFIFVGNMYPTKYSILRKLKSNPKWTKFICGGILADGTSLWEELQPIEQLLAEFSSDLAMGHPEIFFAEVLNDENANANLSIDLSKIPEYKFEGDVAVGNFIIIDPSNDKVNSDAVSIGYFEIHEATPVLKELIEDRLSPGDTIAKALELALRKGCSLIAVESNAYQYSLLYWFDFICAQRQISGINAVEIYSGSLSKNARILTMFKSLLKGEIVVHPNCIPAVHLQCAQFNPLKRDNTDGILDLLTYSPKVIELYGEFCIRSNVIETQEWQVLEVQQNNSCF